MQAKFRIEVANRFDVLNSVSEDMELGVETRWDRFKNTIIKAK